MPPAAPTLPEYATPTVPFGSDVVITDRGAAPIVMLSPFDAVTLAPSVTRTVNGNAPAVLGVPDRLPLALNETPSGRLPDSTLHA